MHTDNHKTNVSHISKLINIKLYKISYYFYLITILKKNIFIFNTKMYFKNSCICHNIIIKLDKTLIFMYILFILETGGKRS